MLEKPDLPDGLIVSRLQDQFDLSVDRITFLPLGVDVNAAVYRIDTPTELAYFLKLRKGVFSEVTVALPRFLKSQGIQAIIAPLPARSGALWGSLGGYKMILYPFIQGKDGYQVDLTEGQWAQFGSALKQIHTAQIPPELSSLIPSETYSPHWREEVRQFQALVGGTDFEEPVAAKLAVLMREKWSEIDHLVQRAGELGDVLRSRNLEVVLCHADIHAGNLLISGDGAVYIVDWDNPICAPKERDLMFIGGGISSRWHTSREEKLFYQGYGPAQVDRMALAYYRYERVIEDIAAFCEQLLCSTEGGEDREQGFAYFSSNFEPGHEIELARKTLEG